MIISVSICILGGLVNWLIRGGGIEKWFPGARMTKAGNAILFGCTAYLLADNVSWGIIAAIAMYFGQMPSVFDKQSDVALNNRDLIWWNMVVFERGLVWAVPLVLAGYMSHGLGGLWFLTALLMPVAYFPVYYKRKYWPHAEFIYGLFLWFPLSMVAP